MSSDVEQLDLIPRRRKCPPVDKERVKALPSLRRAIAYSLSLADMDPKEAYGPLEMDKAVWSRISNGGMSFPADQLCKLRQVTDNDAPLVWLAHQMGYDLRPLRSELEEQLEAERAENAELRKQIETITNFIRSTRGNG